MLKKYYMVILFLLIFLLGMVIINAEKEEKNDVTIDPNDYVSDPFWTTDKDEKIDITVKSDIPVDVYIFSSNDYWDDVVGLVPDYSDAKYSKKGITSTSFTFTCPDDQLYCLVISNPNNSKATVDYEYENVTETEALYSFFNCICGMVITVILVVVIIIIFFWYRKKKRQPQYYLPQYPPQQPYYPPSQYPPQQPPPK